MQIHRNEITTGVLVLGTLIAFITVLVIVGMPGLITPQKTFRIYFDNAAGIRPGAPVLLAGREIGKVTALESPVPMDLRPAGHPDDEVLIVVQVAKDAAIYNNVTVHLTQQGMMGVQVIDFVHGDGSTGFAQNHTTFVGTRILGVGEAMGSLVDNIKHLTGPDSDLALTITNVKHLTESDSDLALTLNNVKHLTGPDSNLALTLKNVKTFTGTLNNSPLSQVITNAEQFTDTIKRQPWRLIWPSTKSYPDDKKAPPDQHK